MRRDFAFVLALVCCLGPSMLGCTTPGGGSGAGPMSWFTQGPSQAPATQTPPTQLTQHTTPVAEQQSEGFSFSKMMQFAGFQKPETPAPATTPQQLIPQSVTNLGSMISSVSAQSAALNVNDPPEVTRQKAQAIMASLQGWDGALAQSNSTGFVNDKMAQTLNTWVGQIRTEAQKLVQYMPNPQSIAAIQQLGASLSTTFSTVTSMMNQTNGLSQAFLGSNRG